MELPPLLRRAVERALDGKAIIDLATTAATLSQRYREEKREGRVDVANEKVALAYLATRLPATYAAVRASFAAVAETQPDFAPQTMLDLGAGPGTALWAAADCWPDIADATLIEASPVFRAVGEQLATGTELSQVTWCTADVSVDAIAGEPRDLVTLAYVLNELVPDVRPAVIDRLWQLTAGTLVIVEPGTPAGWQRILAARRQLIDSGAHVIVPCSHMHACPLQPPDWCHFAERVARSRLHRQAKGAEVPWEDEKFSYVAVSRQPAAALSPRVLARPRKASGRVMLKLCRTDGSAAEQFYSRRDGALYKRAARCDWGSAFDDRH